MKATPRKTLHLTQSEFDELGEYSASLPDSYARPLSEGGRRWRRRFPYGASVEAAQWSVGEYYRSPELDAKKLIGIIWYDVAVRPDGVPFRGRVGAYDI